MRRIQKARQPSDLRSQLQTPPDKLLAKCNSLLPRNLAPQKSRTEYHAQNVLRSQALVFPKSSSSRLEDLWLYRRSRVKRGL